MEKRVVEPTKMEEFEEKITANRKTFLLFIAALFAACVSVGCISLFIKFPYSGWLQLAGVLFLGTVYVTISQKKFIEQAGPSQLTKAVYFSLALLFSLGVVHFFQGKVNVLNLMALSCAFLLPAIISSSWQAFISIPNSQKYVWYYTNDMAADASFIYLDNTPVKLMLVIDGAKISKMRASLPAALELNTAIYYQIKTQNPLKNGQQIFFNEDEAPYGWVFYTKKLLSKSYLVPDDTISETESNLIQLFTRNVLRKNGRVK